MNKSNAISRQEVLSNVYVVYGNNTALGDKIYTFLKECALRPITKEMASNLTGEGSPFVGRIIDVAFEHAQAVLVLLSGDEQVRLRKEWHKRQEELYEVRFSPQSMLEQIFEAGYAFGKYPERTILLQADNVRPFSDIAERDITLYRKKRRIPSYKRSFKQHWMCHTYSCCSTLCHQNTGKCMDGWQN